MTESFIWPNEEIRHAGYSLLGEFQTGLFSEMGKILEPLYGSDWFQKCLTHEKWSGKKHEKDLSVLLKETVQFANQNFRMAIAKSVLNEQTLTKGDLDTLDSILDYRHLWSHESSEESKRITHNDLKNLAISIEKFAMNDSVKISCQNAIQKKDLADLIFSLPVVARHLPENVRSKEQIQRISEYLQEKHKDKKSGARLDELEVQELLRVASHGWKKAELKFDYLFIQFRLLQIRMLSKIQVDANSLPTDFFLNHEFEEDLSVLAKYKYLFGDNWVDISDEISLLSEESHKVFEESLVEINQDIAKLALETKQFKEISEQDNCQCDVCKLIPGAFMNPFMEEDIARNKFIESRVFDSDSGVRFIKLLPAKEQPED